MSSLYEKLYKFTCVDFNKFEDTFEDVRIVNMIRMAPNGRDLETPILLRYFKHPPASAYPMNLMDGLDTFVYPSECVNNLVRLEKYLMLQDHEEVPPKVQFCTQRSCLSEIMHRGLGSRNKIQFYASKFQNRIFMMKCSWEFSVSSKYPSLKLRINSFADSPDMDIDFNRVANESEQTFTIYRAKLKDFDILYSGEVDGIRSDTELKDINDMDEINKCHFVRVRSVGYKHNALQMKKFWTQAYLSKINDIYVAKKDREKIVHEPLEHMTLESIQTKYKIEPKIGCGYLSKCLELIEGCMATVNCPYTVYEFRIVGDNVLEYRVHEGRTRYSFLSEEFIEFMQKKK